MSAFRLLVKWVDTQAATSKDRLLWIPLGYEREQARRDRMISVLFILGLGEKQIASIACMSERHVKAVRQRMEQTGMLPLILRKAGVKALRKGRPGKSD